MPRLPEQDGGTARLLLVGRIAGVYGVKGWVRIHSYTNPVSSLLDYRPWVFGENSQVQDAGLETAREHGKGLIAKFDGFDDRDVSAGLSGTEIFVPRDVLPEADPGEYYWDDLIGMNVTTATGRELGRVTGLLETGAHDVLRIGSESGEVLVPFVVDETVLEVRLDQKQILVDWDWD